MLFCLERVVDQSQQQITTIYFGKLSWPITAKAITTVNWAELFDQSQTVEKRLQTVSYH